MWIVLLTFAAFAHSALALDAGEVYAKVYQSVVKIKGVVGGSGSGVIVDPEGWILTNRHVVDSPQGYTVEVEKEDGEILVYKKANARVAVHGNYDFAIVKIDPKEHDHKLVVAEVFTDPASGDTTKKRIMPGTTCYAIGHPLGQTKAITNGIVTTTHYKHEQDPKGLTYIQISAVVQGGNSGGPVLNDQGQVIGLATFFTADPRGGSGLTGCVPYRIFGDALTAWKKAEPDAKQAKEWEKRGDEMLKQLEEALDSVGPEDPRVKEFERGIGQMYSQALGFAPEDTDIMVKVARMYYRIHNYKAVAPVLVRAISIDPWKHPSAYGYLGMSLINSGAEDDGKAALEEGLIKSPDHAELSWTGLGQYFAKKDKLDEAIYYAKVASDLAEEGDDKEKKSLTYKFYTDIKYKLRDKNLDEPTEDDIDKWYGQKVKELKTQHEKVKEDKKPYALESFEKYMKDNAPEPIDKQEKAIGGDGFKVPFNRKPGEVAEGPADDTKPTTPPTATPDKPKPTTPPSVTTKPDKPKPTPPTAAEDASKWIQGKLGLARLYRNANKPELAIAELKKIIERYPKEAETEQARELLKELGG